MHIINKKFVFKIHEFSISFKLVKVHFIRIYL